MLAHLKSWSQCTGLNGLDFLAMDEIYILDLLRPQRSGAYSDFHSAQINQFKQSLMSKLSMVLIVPNFGKDWTTCNTCGINSLHSQLNYVQFTHFWRKFCRPLFTHFLRQLLWTEKQNPSTFPLLECMIGLSQWSLWIPVLKGTYVKLSKTPTQISRVNASSECCKFVPGSEIGSNERLTFSFFGWSADSSISSKFWW